MDCADAHGDDSRRRASIGFGRGPDQGVPARIHRGDDTGRRRENIRLSRASARGDYCLRHLSPGGGFRRYRIGLRSSARRRIRARAAPRRAQPPERALSRRAARTPCRRGRRHPCAGNRWSHRQPCRAVLQFDAGHGDGSSRSTRHPANRRCRPSRGESGHTGPCGHRRHRLEERVRRTHGRRSLHRHAVLLRGSSDHRLGPSAPGGGQPAPGSDRHSRTCHVQVTARACEGMRRRPVDGLPVAPGSQSPKAADRLDSRPTRRLARRLQGEGARLRD